MLPNNIRNMKLGEHTYAYSWSHCLHNLHGSGTGSCRRCLYSQHQHGSRQNSPRHTRQRSHRSQGYPFHNPADIRTHSCRHYSHRRRDGMGHSHMATWDIRWRLHRTRTLVDPNRMARRLNIFICGLYQKKITPCVKPQLMNTDHV